MNPRNILGLAVITALGLTLLPGSALAQQKSLKEQLVGTWTVASWEQTNKDGSKFHRFGTNPKGVHVFDANGRYVVMFAHPDLPKIASNNPSTPTPEELKGLVGRSIAYYGTYTVDEATKVITLRVEASSFPNQVGVDTKRTISSLAANELKYSNPVPMTGGQIDIAFKRAPAAATN
jgi:Lipocalin-like domain